MFPLHNPRPNKLPTGLAPSLLLLFLVNVEQTIHFKFIRVILIGILLGGVGRAMFPGMSCREGWGRRGKGRVAYTGYDDVTLMDAAVEL
ncbi:hypothetical protein E2C01_081912 [Portunus trituberculatus]|uniref:Uncharacterized protein n=1 Tax=Portunus trituberculatus TaxID=210409 RepID=A0A5B7IXW0_PORTR|nr:hypothetical protein [Portunus trituberculatus]